MSTMGADWGNARARDKAAGAGAGGLHAVWILTMVYFALSFFDSWSTPRLEPRSYRRAGRRWWWIGGMTSMRFTCSRFPRSSGMRSGLNPSA